ncbi:MAG: hypothetical protein U0521_18485 [Anaerolineae bacterium]
MTKPHPAVRQRWGIDLVDDLWNGGDQLSDFLDGVMQGMTYNGHVYGARSSTIRP